MARVLVGVRGRSLSDVQQARTLFWLRSLRELGHDLTLIDDRNSPLVDRLPPQVSHLQIWGRQPFFSLWQLAPSLAGPTAVEFDAVVLLFSQTESLWGPLRQLAALARGRDWRGRPALALELNHGTAPAGLPSFSDLDPGADLDGPRFDTTARFDLFWAEGRDVPWLEAACSLLDQDPTAHLRLAGRGKALSHNDWLLVRERLNEVGEGRWLWTGRTPQPQQVRGSRSVCLAGADLSSTSLRAWVAAAEQAGSHCFLGRAQDRLLEHWRSRSHGTWTVLPERASAWHASIHSALARNLPLDDATPWSQDNLANDLNRLLNLHLRLHQ